MSVIASCLEDSDWIKGAVTISGNPYIRTSLFVSTTMCFQCVEIGFVEVQRGNYCCENADAGSLSKVLCILTWYKVYKLWVLMPHYEKLKMTSIAIHKILHAKNTL